MTITISDYGINEGTHELYDVVFFGEPIQTTVTKDPDVVDSCMDLGNRADPPLQTRPPESRPRRGVASDLQARRRTESSGDSPTLQLCVGRRCLIFQIIHAPRIPQSLKNFLLNETYRFVGVGIKSDVKKLEDYYKLSVSNVGDLGEIAARMGRVDMRSVSMKVLVMEFLKKEIPKPTKVRTSRWDNRRLTPDQVMYACVDAYVSFLLGKLFRAGEFFLDYYCSPCQSFECPCIQRPSPTFTNCLYCG